VRIGGVKLLVTGKKKRFRQHTRSLVRNSEQGTSTHPSAWNFKKKKVNLARRGDLALRNRRNNSLIVRRMASATRGRGGRLSQKGNEQRKGIRGPSGACGAKVGGRSGKRCRPVGERTQLQGGTERRGESPGGTNVQLASSIGSVSFPGKRTNRREDGVGPSQQEGITPKKKR